MNKPIYLIFGNAESDHLLKWVRELVKYYNVFILSPLGVHQQIKELVPSENIFVLNMKINPGGGNAKMLMKIFTFRKIFRQIRPVIVNAHYITSHGLISALLKKLFGLRFFLVESAWGTDILVTPQKNRFYKCITKYSLKSSNIITSDSDYMSNVVREFTSVQCLTFPFGLDKMPEVTVEEKDPNLYFSNRALTENYNIDKVIELFSEVVKTNREARLVISNDGDLRNKMEKLVKDLNLEEFISFRGFLNAQEQSEIYKKATYFLSLPTSDSTSVSLLEAMAYGCIPILSDLPANREWVVNGINGVIYTTKAGLINHIPDKFSAFNENRNIISKRAIFSDSILKLVNVIMSELQHI